MDGLQTGNIPYSGGMAALNFSYAMGGPTGLVGAAEGLGFDWGGLFKAISPITQAVGARIQQPGTTIQTTPGGSLVTRQETGYPIISGGFATGMDAGTAIAIGLGALALVLVMKGRR